MAGAVWPAAVLTCTERAFADPAEDRAGSVLRQGLEDLGFAVCGSAVPPDQQAIRDGIVAAIEGGARVVVTAGGTGLLPTDVTVQATRPLVAYELPGIMEEVRRLGAQKTSLSLLSRGIVGVVELDGSPRALVINAPGSRGGARDTLAVAGPLLHRIIDSLDGVDHDMNLPASGAAHPDS